MVFSSTSSLILQADDLIFIAGNGAARAVLTVFVAEFVPSRFRFTLTTAFLHFDLVDRFPAVFRRNMTSKVSFDGTALDDAFTDSATTDRFDAILSDVAILARSWVNAWWALADLLEASVSGTGNGNSVECLGSGADFISNLLTITFVDGAASDTGGRNNFLISIALVSGLSWWAPTNLFGAAVRAINSDSL